MVRRSEAKIILSFAVVSLMITSTLSFNTAPQIVFGAIPSGRNGAAGGHISAPFLMMDTSVDFSSPKVSESSTASVSANSEEYVFVKEFAANQQFGNPDITIDESDNVYVADYFNNRVLKFDSDGNLITQWGTQGSADGQFINPQDVGLDSAGFVYVVDTRNHRIQKFTDNGQFVANWGSQGSADGQFNFPDRIAVDSNDIIYVTDDGNGRVQKFNTAGQFVGKFGENYLNVPVGIGVDSNNDVYVAESGGNRVSKFTSTGQLLTAWGSFGSTDGRFNQPKGLHVDAEDNVFVADEFNDRVQKFDKDGNFITKFDGLLGHPIDVAVDSMGQVFVSDENNGQILVYALALSTPTIPELIDTINGMGVKSSNALINPLEHMCKDLNMFLSKVDSFESSGKLTSEQAQELRQLGTALKNELAC
jgi:DNA-binding beta-propeller fold protein YncE